MSTTLDNVAFPSPLLIHWDIFNKLPSHFKFSLFCIFNLENWRVTSSSSPITHRVVLQIILILLNKKRDDWKK